MTEKHPSMKEILGSIRRIIAEDSDDFDLAFREKHHNGGTEQDGAGATGAGERESGTHEDSPVIRLEKSKDVDRHSGDEDIRRDAQADEDGLLSAKIESEVSRAFGVLRKSIVVPRARETSLDEMVREMLQPLLRQWLDEHLPKIVERLLREELRRISQDTDG